VLDTHHLVRDTLHVVRRVTSEDIGATVSSAILAAGTDVPATAQAAGLTTPQLRSRLSGAEQFSFGELVEISGLLRTSAADLIVRNAA